MHPALVELFREQPQIGEVITWGENAPKLPPSWNTQIEVMELPHIFRSTRSSLPCHVPYLKVDSERIEDARFFDNVAAPRVGLCWASSQWDTRRAITLTGLAPLFDLLPSTLYSVQWGQERQEIGSSGLSSRIIDTVAYKGSIAETAAVIDSLDLVITVDGMVAHLAGALGKTVWLMLPFEADWRWGLDPHRSIWYPTMKLFRQASRGNWGSVIAALQQELGQPS